MICPKCRADLHQGRADESFLRGRGLLIKSDSVAMVCPRCKHEVDAPREVMQSLQKTLLLYFRK